MKNVPKSLERIEQDDFSSNFRGVATMLFRPQNIYVSVKNQKFSLDEAPSVIVNGKKSPVVELI